MPEVPIIQEARVCPITTVQDSIDALALSLFEALRGIRDATVASSSSSSSLSLSAYQEDEEEEEDEQRQLVLQQQISSLLENHTRKEDGSRTGGDNSSNNNIDNEAIRLAKLRLLHGLNVNYFSQRAYDTNNPDYESFLIAYLSEDKYAKELIDMMHNSTTTNSNKTTTKKDEEESSSSSSSIANSEVVKSVKASSDATTTKKTKLSIKLNVSSSKQQQQQLLPKHDIIESTNTSSGSSTSTSSNGILFPRNQKEYVQLLHSSQLSQDTCITHNLAKNVLCKSNTIDTLVANLPGMDRNRSTQLERIHELITLNQQLSHELEVAYGIANDRREEIRCALRENTCLALGIEEEE
jgi:hypothetical protein